MDETETVTVILAVTEPEMLVGSRGSVPAMTRDLLVHPDAQRITTGRHAVQNGE